MTDKTVNGAPDVAALRAEIEQTRAELGETVQALAAKADVKARMKESAAHKAAQVRDSANHAVERARERPVPWLAVAGAVAAAVVAVLIIRGRRR
ncbi:MAG TPA: DUF3618 domain-containing protein [Micromonosporaceae bacterium]|nr:DUF3618 domain-containing protein [Micromonosporaceae bacterium]